MNALSTSGLANLQDGIRIEGAASTAIGGVGLARNVIGGNFLNGIGIYSSTAGAAIRHAPAIRRLRQRAPAVSDMTFLP